MPTISDFLLKAGANVQANVFVRLTNNVTAVSYVSTALTDSNGTFTVSSVPPGTYTVATGPSVTGPWTNTGDANYTVPVANGDDIGAKSLTLATSSPFTPSARAGTIQNLYFLPPPTGTDDTTVIQAYEDAANTAGGGLIVWGPGTYISTLLTKRSSVSWLGAGQGATTLKLKNATNTALLRSLNFLTLTGGNTTGGITGFFIRGMSFDGNQANNVSMTVPLIQFYAYGYTMDDFTIVGAGQDAFYSEWSTSGPVIGAQGLEARISNFAILISGRHGLVWNGPHDSRINNGAVQNSVGHGVWVQANGAATEFTNVHAWGATSDWSWFLDVGVLMIMCQGEDATVGACWVRASNIQIVGGAWFATPIGLRIGITAGAAPTGTVVRAVMFNNCSTAAIDYQNDGGTNSIEWTTTGGNAAARTGTRASNTLEIGGNSSIGPGLYSLLSAGSSGTFAITDTGGAGANILLTGNGATTPTKRIRVQGGNLQVMNDANSQAQLQLGDGGDMFANGRVYPGAFASGFQAGGGIWGGAGVPAAGSGGNGDFYLRTDGGGAGATHIYFKNAGAWIGIA